MNFLNKTIEYGLYFLVFLLPIQTRWIIKAGAAEYSTYSLYGTDILLLAVLLLFIIREIASSSDYRLLAMTDEGLPRHNCRLTLWFIGGLLLMSVVSVYFAIDKTLALYKFGWLIMGVGLFWLITGANYNKVKLIYAMLAGIFLQAVLGVWQFLTQSSFSNKWLGMALHNAADLGTSVIEAVGADGVGERWLRAYGGLDHPNILGGIMAVGVLLLIGKIIKHDKFLIFNFTNWLLLMTFTAALFFSFSRSAWLGLIFGLVIITVLAIVYKNLKLQKGLAEIILVMGVLLLILFSQYQNLVTSRLSSDSRLENKSTSERLTSYKESWQMIKNNWAFGAGLGNYTLALRRQVPDQESFYYQPAHNVFLLAWAEIGIAGLLFFVIVIIYAFTRLPGRLDYSFFGNYNAILIALIIMMSFDHWLFSLHFGILFFWLIMGLIINKSDA